MDSDFIEIAEGISTIYTESEKTFKRSDHSFGSEGLSYSCLIWMNQS